MNNRKCWQVVCAHAVDGTLMKSKKLTLKQANSTAAVFAASEHFNKLFTHIVVVPFYP